VKRLDEGTTDRDAVVLPASRSTRLTLDQYRDQIRSLVMNHPGVLIKLEEPIRLASGDLSCDFVDGKLAVDEPENFSLVGAAMFAAANEAGVEFDAVGGLLVGAAPFTFAVAQTARSKWFLVRKEPKGRGTNLWIEGTRITPDMPVMIVDDVVTRGESIQKACELVEAAGARVVFATTLVDRGDFAAGYFLDRNIPYHPILTYNDLDIDPVGDQSRHAQAV
jgi:orotate phosphoribosyltransferase